MAEKKGSVLGGVVALGLAAAGLYSCNAMLTPKVMTAAEKAADKRLSAFIRCENATKGRVADPSGMRFAPYGEWMVVWGDNADSVRFDFEVVARNAYGGLVPAQMECTATYDGEHWTATDVKQW